MSRTAELTSDGEPARVLTLYLEKHRSNPQLAEALKSVLNDYNKLDARRAAYFAEHFWNQPAAVEKLIELAGIGFEASIARFLFEHRAPDCYAEVAAGLDAFWRDSILPQHPHYFDALLDYVVGRPKSLDDLKAVERQKRLVSLQIALNLRSDPKLFREMIEIYRKK